ncbi:hypothetical protein XELAEV_18002091mg [Xenopus laevis]|nr:hypothetical protein XELAEV_18002091mg [Xenopus laevis]
MGSKVASSYANLYMTYLESHKVYNHPLYKTHCRLYLRYIDDQLMIWDGIVSNTNKYEERRDEMKHHFEECGYPREVLKKGLALSENESRGELLHCSKKKNRDNDSKLVFVSNFSTASESVSKIIHKHWHLLTSCFTNIPAFAQPPLMAYKRAKSLRDNLVRDDIGPLKQKSTRFLCNPKLFSNVFYHPHSGKKYNIREYYTCDFSYEIYSIKCPCELIYIGETTQKIKDRISKHKSTIRKQLTALPVPAHFQEAKHTISTVITERTTGIQPPVDSLCLGHHLPWEACFSLQ